MGVAGVAGVAGEEGEPGTSGVAATDWHMIFHKHQEKTPTAYPDPTGCDAFSRDVTWKRCTFLATTARDLSGECSMRGDPRAWLCSPARKLPHATMHVHSSALDRTAPLSRVQL